MTAPKQPVVVVTGAGQGLGRAVAIAFSNAGFTVALVGRTLSKLEATAAMLAGPSRCIAADLTDPDQVRSAFVVIAEAYGGVDVLINNAASYRPFAIDRATDDMITSVIDQTLVAPIFCVREALPLLRARGQGDIVNISSQSVETPQPHMIVYAAAKAGVEVFSQGLRYELAGEPIRIITFQLGAIANTQLGEGWEDHEAIRAAHRRAGIDKLFALPGANPESIAASMVHAVTAPRDIYLKTIEVRGT